LVRGIIGITRKIDVLLFLEFGLVALIWAILEDLEIPA